MMNLEIQQFAADDYQGLADLCNLVYTENPTTADEIRFDDEQRDKRCRYERWVVRSAHGRLVASGSYGQNPFLYDPHKFDMQVVVHPESQRQGIGGRLFAHLSSEVERFEPVLLRAFCREYLPGGMRFVEQRGFHEQERLWESRLRVDQFDFTPYARIEDGLAGIEILTYAGMADDPDRARKLYELDIETGHDISSVEPMTDISFEFFLNRFLNDPNFLPEATFIAVHDGAFVGVSNLSRMAGAADKLDTGYTGVQREFRGRGLALALKLRAIRYAHDAGISELVTMNHSLNRPMLSINEKLGFVRQPALIVYARTETPTP